MPTKPTRIGKYEIIEELGRGGFATVYKARDVELDRVVAVKVLYPHLTADPGFAARFRQEARAAARLRHPHIVTVYETGEADDQLYIAMEYLPGRTLQALLEAEGALLLERAVLILEQVAEALDYAHAQGVVHRDVKPGNVMVEETASGVRATLTDFGLVKALAASTALTSAGTLLGSPEYMAPEQAVPEWAREVGPAADRYALGVVAYQMLTGRVPFPGNTLATLYAHVRGSVPLPRLLRPGLSAAVEAALLKMLANAPTERFPSASAFVARLREALSAEQESAEMLAVEGEGRIEELPLAYRDVAEWTGRGRDRLRPPPAPTDSTRGPQAAEGQGERARAWLRFQLHEARGKLLLTRERLEAQLAEIGSYAGRVRAKLRREVETEGAHREVRYLNTHFSRSRPKQDSTSDDPVPQGSRLGRGRTYYVAVDIRSDRTGSHAVDEVHWPDQQLPDRELAETQGGWRLWVALFSQDFTLVEDQKPLWLPLYGPSERLYFQVVAPDRLGLAQTRLCVYYKNNLVQSRMLYAHVGRGRRTEDGRGNWSEVEATLSATFGDLERLQPRGLNIAFNEDSAGTHALFVRGPRLKDNVFDLRDEMTEALRAFRGALNKIMFEEGTERYRLDQRSDEPNWGTDDTLTTDLRRLAHVGRKWHRDLFGEKKQHLEDALRQRLEHPTTIQIVRLKGKHIFPWAVLYDMPLVRSNTNKVCLEFRRHVTPDNTLDYAACRTACPHLDCSHNPPEHDTDVVCVFGFWGIKHVVEQPLSASIELDEDGSERERRPSSVHSVIEYEGKPVLHVGISQRLVSVGPHVKALQDWVSREGTFQSFQPDRTLQAIGQGLSSTPLHVYYFYCHGGQSESDQEVWLSVGDGEYIMPDHIRDKWKLRRKWEKGQPPLVPLVFLNGCGTLSLSPESVADFLQEFTVAGAAGVVGTETSVDERLAQEVGLEFLKGFAQGRAAAPVIQELRHRLLLKNNPLGLVYTPYCYAELHLESNRWRNPKDGKEMVRVPAGKFLYGDDKREVELPEFWIDKAPVTNAEYARFVAETGHEPPRHWNGKTPPKKIADHPVVYVTWNDATAYAKWAGGRLPTEEEWEKAARGTDGREYPWGEWTEDHCNSEEAGLGDTTPVGQYSPQGDSPYGCVDMAGNVWEWTTSEWEPGDERRVVRGGLWSGNQWLARCAYRDWNIPDLFDGFVGLRVVVSLALPSSES